MGVRGLGPGAGFLGSQLDLVFGFMLWSQAAPCLRLASSFGMSAQGSGEHHLAQARQAGRAKVPPAMRFTTELRPTTVRTEHSQGVEFQADARFSCSVRFVLWHKRERRLRRLVLIQGLLQEMRVDFTRRILRSSISHPSIMALLQDRHAFQHQNPLTDPYS